MTIKIAWCRHQNNSKCNMHKIHQMEPKHVKLKIRQQQTHHTKVSHRERIYSFCKRSCKIFHLKSCRMKFSLCTRLTQRLTNKEHRGQSSPDSSAWSNKKVDLRFLQVSQFSKRLHRNRLLARER